MSSKSTIGVRTSILNFKSSATEWRSQRQASIVRLVKQLDLKGLGSLGLHRWHLRLFLALLPVLVISGSAKPTLCFQRSPATHGQIGQRCFEKSERRQLDYERIGTTTPMLNLSHLNAGSVETYRQSCMA